MYLASQLLTLIQIGREESFYARFGHWEGCFTGTDGLQSIHFDLHHLILLCHEGSTAQTTVDEVRKFVN